MKPYRTPKIAWLVILSITALYELWGLFQGYEFTLTAGARSAVEYSPWLAGVIAMFAAWLVTHLLIEKRKKNGKN